MLPEDFDGFLADLLRHPQVNLRDRQTAAARKYEERISSALGSK
jgi:hypothetical protein